MQTQTKLTARSTVFAGTVKTEGKASAVYAAGVSHNPSKVKKWTVIHCYNTGKVSAKKGCKNVGGILGCYTNHKGTAIGKYYVYDNYSTTSPIYGTSTISGAVYRAREKGFLCQQKELYEAFK